MNVSLEDDKSSTQTSTKKQKEKEIHDQAKQDREYVHHSRFYTLYLFLAHTVLPKSITVNQVNSGPLT